MKWMKLRVRTRGTEGHTMIIPAARLHTAAQEAFDALDAYMKHSSMSPLVMLQQLNAAGPYAQWSLWFAKVAASASAQRFARLVPQGDGSWLMRVAGRTAIKPTIALNSKQLREWGKAHTHPDRRFAETLITDRCIYHEVGHIKLHGHLLAAGAVWGLAPQATPQEEEEAWVFCFIVLGMVVGDYAEHCRERRNMDDSPTAIV